MAKTLSEQQREWLDTALRSKGRFTLAKTVKSNWEDYVRRRDKAALNGAGLLPDDPRKKAVDEGLRRADDLAKAGKFSEAYKSLDAVKKMGAQASVERARTVQIGGLNARINVIRSYADDVINLCDFAERHYEPIFDQLANKVPASAKADLREATLHLKVIATDHQVMLGEMAGREQWVVNAAHKVRERNLIDQLAEVDRDITVHIAAGHRDQVQSYADRTADLAQRLRAKRFYTVPDESITIQRTMRGRFDDAFRRLRDISRFQPDGPKQGTQDDKTTNARKDLEGTSDWTEDDEEERLRQVGLALTMGGLRDRKLTTDTDAPPVNKAPEPQRFDPGLIFDEVLTGIGEVPDDIPYDLAEQIKGKVRTRLKEVLKSLDPGSDQMFDLMISTKEELQALCNRGLTGIDNPKGVAQSHDLLLSQLAEEMRAEISLSAPNQMSDDAKTIKVGGKVYTLDEVLGEGTNGAVRRYTDGEKTFVVKTLKKTMGNMEGEERFNSMSREMRTHHQVMKGSDDGVTDTDNLISMEGAAVSKDGSLHMIMEEAEGGDMATVGNNLVMLQQLGVIPDEARKVIALDMIAQCVKGMKAMQERGLVQNDLKPQNMMINKDGTVKIIDFGESRFVDDTTGLAPNAKQGEFNTTPGYEAPEHFGRNQGIDSKADTFALGGIVKTLMDPGMSQEAVFRDQEGVTAMGRLTGALTDPDPTKRPSLDAVLMSSLLDQVANDFNPEDVKDLQKAAAEMNVAMKGVKSSLTAQELKNNVPEGKGVIDGLWVPYLEKGLVLGTEVPIVAINTMVMRIDDEIIKQDLAMRKEDKGMGQELQAKIDKLKEQKAFWMAKMSSEVETLRTEGKKEIDDAIDDEWNAMVLPDPEGGHMTMKEAVARRDDAIATISRLQLAFYDMARDDPQRAQALMNETNVTLQQLDRQISWVNDEILRLVGPKGKYFMAEQKLSEVSARFGPRKVSGQEISDKATPRRPTEGEEQGELPPLPEGEIPEPPELPKTK